MARLARVVAPGYPHHVTQRGNRRQPTFFTFNDYKLYLSLLKEQCNKFNVDIWAYCLMPNHVHLVAVPQLAGGLCSAIGETHRRYTVRINRRMGWTGYLWQGRFASCPMDEAYLLATVRYIERNPVAAGLVKLPQDYRWSSAAFHLDKKRTDPVVSGSPLPEMVADWESFLGQPDKETILKDIRKAARVGRPLGSKRFVKDLEWQLNRDLERQKPGPKCKK